MVLCLKECGFLQLQAHEKQAITKKDFFKEGNAINNLMAKLLGKIYPATMTAVLFFGPD